jgi:hypothetical protein
MGPHIRMGPIRMGQVLQSSICMIARADALAQFQSLLGNLADEENQRITHGELEAMVHTEGTELLRRLIQGHLDQRSVEEPIHERVVGEDGVARTHRREGCQRRLESRFGGASSPVVATEDGVWTVSSPWMHS